MAFSLARAEERFAKPPAPSEWMTLSNDGLYITVNREKIPAVIVDAARMVIANLDMGNEAFQRHIKEEPIVQGVVIPNFGTRLCGEQHLLYMVPFMIDTPPLLALLMAFDRGTTSIPSRITADDAHAQYRTYMEAIEWMLRFGYTATTEEEKTKMAADAARITAANERYEALMKSAEKWMAETLVESLTGIVGKLRATAPKGDETPMPNYSTLYSHDSVQAYAAASHRLMLLFLAASEIAIVRMLDVSVDIASQAGLVTKNPDRTPLMLSALTESQRADLFNHERVMVSQMNKDVVPPEFQVSRPLPPEIEQIGISPEFLFVNCALMCMGIAR